MGIHSQTKRRLSPDFSVKAEPKTETEIIHHLWQVRSINCCTLWLFNCEHEAWEQALSVGLSLPHTGHVCVCGWGWGLNVPLYTWHTTSGVWHTTPPELHGCFYLQVSSVGTSETYRKGVLLPELAVHPLHAEASKGKWDYRIFSTFPKLLPSMQIPSR